MKYDSIIIGSGTAGLYLANRLALLGHKVLVVEKDIEKDIAKRLDILHFGYDGYEKFGIPAPEKSSKEFEHHFLYSYSSSALDTYKKKNYHNIYAIHLPLMNERMRNIAKSNGVDFMFETKFTDFILFSNGEIKGVKLESKGKVIELETKLVVDASGIPSVARRKVVSPYMETFEIGPMDRFYVILKYVNYKDKKNETIDCQSWPYYKCWIGPYKAGGGIIGTGASTSFDYCKKKQEYFESKLPRPDYEFDHYEYGSTPYTRCPYSFVAPHFLAIGDAACMTNPMSGEGLTYHFDFIKQNLDIIHKALKEDNTSIDNLWEINVRYNRGFYKDPVFTRALIACLMQMNEKENEFLYKHGIIFKDDLEPEPNMPKEFANGALKGEIRPKTLLNLVKNLTAANNLKNHYANYPLTKDGYTEWTIKAQKLWDKAGKITDADK